ncbi:MAG: hypothetical protein AAF417_15090 [Pseudomonadota bacterium]
MAFSLPHLSPDNEALPVAIEPQSRQVTALLDQLGDDTSMFGKAVTAQRRPAAELITAQAKIRTARETFAQAGINVAQELVGMYTWLSSQLATATPTTSARYMADMRTVLKDMQAILKDEGAPPEMKAMLHFYTTADPANPNARLDVTKSLSADLPADRAATQPEVVRRHNANTEPLTP